MRPSTRELHALAVGHMRGPALAVRQSRRRSVPELLHEHGDARAPASRDDAACPFHREESRVGAALAADDYEVNRPVAVSRRRIPLRLRVV